METNNKSSCCGAEVKFTLINMCSKCGHACKILPQEKQSVGISDEEINKQFPEDNECDGGPCDDPCYAKREGAKWMRSKLTPTNSIDREALKDFFMWFRDNGELYVDKSIEDMIEIYQKESN